MKKNTLSRLLQIVVPFLIMAVLLGFYRYLRVPPMSADALKESRAGLLPSYVGAEVCGRCHRDVYESWNKTKMAHAMEILPDTAIGNAACLRCHTTGGEALAKPLPGVQCEACHGPGERYVAAMARSADLAEIRAAGLIFPGEADCKRCHTAEQSPDFHLTERTKAGVHAIPTATPSGAQIKAEPVGADRCQSCHGPFHNPCPDRFVGGCEDCHGPGARYIAIMAKSGSADTKALLEAGLIIPKKNVCEDCHGEEGVLVDLATAQAAAPAVPVGAATCQRCHSQKHTPCPETRNCERCHGAGSKFVPLMARRAPKSALSEAGLRRPSRAMCEKCHATRGVTVAVPTGAEGPTRIGAQQCLMCHNDPLPHKPCPETNDCESCHSPGSKYMEVMAAGGSAAERLAAGLVMPERAVCEKCHAERRSSASRAENAAAAATETPSASPPGNPSQHDNETPAAGAKPHE